MDKTTKTFVDYVSAVSFSDLGPDTIHAAKRSLVDSLGCALGAYHVEPIKAIRGIASRTTSTTPATVIGTAIRTAPDLAALVNGAMVRYLDFSDDYFGGVCDTGPHPSDNTGGMLAATDAAGLGGRDLLLGLTVAYEVCAQLADHVTLVRHGWDHPICHSIATSLGAGKLLGLSKEQLGNAVALAVAPNICLNQTRRGQLSNWKAFAGPNGSRAGLFAAILAKEGITGPSDVFEGTEGFMKQLQSPFDLGPLSPGNRPGKIESAFFKSLPVRYAYQLPIWMAVKHRGKVDISQIDSICVYLEKRSIVNRTTYPEYWDPQSTETADHSGPYLIGAALVDGEISKKTFTRERYRDPTVLGVVQKIRMEADPAYTASFPRELNCRIEVGLKSGEAIVLHEKNPKGHPANPMSDNELEAKFLGLADRTLDSKQARALLDQLWNLEKMDDIKKLFSLMLVANRA